MSEFEEEYYEESEDYQLTDEDIFEIQEEYRRKRLIDSLIGPVISTVFHIGLIIILAILITDKYKEEAPEIVVKMQEVEEVLIEEPPPIEEPEPVEEVQEDVTNPVLTTVAIENVDTNDAALEDVSDEAPSTEDDSQVEAVSDVTVSPSAFASPNVFGGRSAAGRASAVSKFGGTSAGQSALKNALWWLAKVQSPDGSWGKESVRVQRALTSLALLTFLAHGETHLSKNFGTHVKKAISWLANDPVGKKNDPYSHGMKTYALCEAYAMTGVYSIEEQMNKCLTFILDHQQKGGCFTYGYNLDETKQDLSVAGWNYQALKAAYGAGCEDPKLQPAIEKSLGWLKSHADEESNGNGFPYDGAKKSKGKHTMRGVGVLCLQLLGEGDYPGMKDEIDKIATYDLEKLNWQNPPKDSLYGWYYSTQAMFQKGGPQWKKWNAKFQKLLMKEQHPEGYWTYPGNKHGSMQEFDEKVFATTFCSLMLTVYYRYLPSSKGAIGGKQKNVKKVVVEEEGLDLLE